MPTLAFGDLKLKIPEPGDAGSPIGCRLWPSSLLLCQYLYDHRSDLVGGKHIMDIGSGTGICGLMALTCGAARAWLQDLPGEDRIARIQRELMKGNGFGEDRYGTFPMRWGEAPEWLPPIDLIISSDTFYEPAHFEGLIASVAHMLDRNPHATFITAYHDRDVEYYIGDLLRLWGLVGRQIDLHGSLDRLPLDWLSSEEDWWPENPADTLFLIEIRPADT